MGLETNGPVVVTTCYRTGSSWILDVIRNLSGVSHKGTGTDWGLKDLNQNQLYHTHFTLPQFIRDQKPSAKIIYMLRDMRDIVTSIYCRSRFLSGFHNEYKDIRSLITDKRFKQYLVVYLNYLVNCPDKDMLPITYEEMYYCYPVVIERLTQFLGIGDIPDSVWECNFANRIKNKKRKDNMRKGIVGDYKNSMDWFDTGMLRIMIRECYNGLVPKLDGVFSKEAKPVLQFGNLQNDESIKKIENVIEKW